MSTRTLAVGISALLGAGLLRGRAWAAALRAFACVSLVTGFSAPVLHRPLLRSTAQKVPREIGAE